MRLTIVGCSGSMPGAESAASCYLIEHDGTRIVLDMGNGAAGALQRYAELETIDAILLSHLHADHCLDACAFVVWHRYSERSRGPVPLYGPNGTSQRLAAAYERPESELTDVFDFRTLSAADRERPTGIAATAKPPPIMNSDLRIGGLRLRFVRTNHPVETYAIRVDSDSASVTYSADTGVCDELVELARGSDLLLCEAAQPDGDSAYPPGLHLTGAQAGEHAAAADVGRLVLTHIPPWVDGQAQFAAARAIFPATELARPGATYDL
ncbi:MAG: MBL fold metallo-hydrolase [Actinomycetota bacterium]|nr:MBL fold metallo-hydrolase [Actinomycetota bacterium]